MVLCMRVDNFTHIDWTRVAKIIKDLKLNIGIRIIFQPAEEIASGARWMIKDGATEGLTYILGVHFTRFICRDNWN